MHNVLEGIRVLELGFYHVGPEATRLLSDLGAEVIKIESKKGGDPTRGVKRAGGLIDARAPGGGNAYFEAFNRNKRSLAIDFTKIEGRDIIYQLVSKSDAFVTNVRRPALERLGLDQQSICKHNPKIIYAHGSGYGPKGPEANSPAFDWAVQARSGIMTLQRPPDATPFIPIGLGDQIASITLAYGVLASLLARERWGESQTVDASILGGMVWLLTTNVMFRSLTGHEFQVFRRETSGNPLFNVYQAKDGKWLCLCMGSQADRYWGRFCQALGIEALENDERFSNLDRREKNREELIKLLDGVFAQKPLAEWLAAMKEYDLVFSPVQNIGDLLEDPQVLTNEYVKEFEHPTMGTIKVLGSPIHLGGRSACKPSAAPELGQHTEEVLMELCGYTWQDIDGLRDRGVI